MEKTVNLLLANSVTIAQTFIHSCSLHTQDDLDRMKTQVAGGTYNASARANMGTNRQDITGRLLYTQPVNGAEHVLKLTGVPNGSYFININNMDKELPRSSLKTN